MKEEIPATKWERTVVSGKTAVNVGGKFVKYFAKKPFLSGQEKELAKDSLEKEYAEEIFKGLVLLKGTALKIAQLLSTELDMVPSAIRQELEKSYNSVPPLNRALVRKAVRNSFKQSPELVFKNFDLNAFAAASLGQVHRAESHEGKQLAVKIQYPGINRTIKNDMKMVQSLVRPMPNSRLMIPVLVEIEERLCEEIDYLQETENATYFYNKLNIDNVVIPAVEQKYCTDTIISSEYLEGLSLDEWIKTNPDQEARDKVASVLNSIFLKSLFELNCLHADPNPGNFLVQKDLTVGLIDFGCVKRFSKEFVDLYRNLTRVMMKGDRDEYFKALHKMKVIKSKIEPKVKDELFDIFHRVAEWYGRTYENDYFDFGNNKDFFVEGKNIMQEFYRFKKNFQPNPELVFLNRTRYGLLRIFERLQARVKIKNHFEWDLEK